MSVYMGIETADLFFNFSFANDSLTSILFTDVMIIGVMGSEFPTQWVKYHLLDVPKSAIFAASHKTRTLKRIETMLNTYKITYFLIRRNVSSK